MDEFLPLWNGRGFGILSRATRDRRGATVVLFNAGLIHRVGPFRIHMHLARRLTALGFDVLRFDLPRVGDGIADQAATPPAPLEAVIDAVHAALPGNALVVGGICSGADSAWQVACADSRVVGLMMFDGFARRDHWFRIGQLQLALSRPLGSWPALLLRALRHRPTPGGDVSAFRDWPTPRQFSDGTAALVARGVRVLALFTGGIPAYLMHRRQIDRSFGDSVRSRSLTVHYWPSFDHILLSPDDRATVLDAMTAWCASLPRPVAPAGAHDA